MVQIEILITVGYLVTGGFQIGKGVWEGDWKDPNCPKQKKREQVPWMDEYMDYGMILIFRHGYQGEAGQKATGISTYPRGCKCNKNKQ